MKVKDLLSSREKWTQDDAAKSKSGRGVHPNSRYAVSWCLMGAIVKCYLHSQRKEQENKLRTILEKRGMNPSVVCFNDDLLRTFQEIREVVELADI